MRGIEELLVNWLPPLVGVRVSTEVPNDLAEQVPMVRVYRNGGPRQFSLAKPAVLVESFAADRISALRLAELVDDLVNYNLPTMVLGHTLGLQGVYSGPSFRNYDNPAVFRYGATYGFTVHQVVFAT